MKKSLVPSLACRFAVAAAAVLVALPACQHRTLIDEVGMDAGMAGQGGGGDLPDAFVFVPVDASVIDVPVCVGADCGPDAAAEPVCGNGALEDGEQCDDRNPIPGDGCSGLCRIEANYSCPTVGQACVSTIVCGDGLVQGLEGCDDKNTANNDGCSAGCVVEDGYACTEPGKACTPVETFRCGDGMVNSGESCDDGNTVSFDGCTGGCQRESGWSCPKPGEGCVRDEVCGDGILTANEECDDADTKPGDGCTGTCKVESFFVCPTPGMKCQSTIVCGDSKVIGDEACDDGDTVGSNGCSADCKTIEPGFTCPRAQGVGGKCTALPMDRCGDSKLSYGEFCDDGGAESNDGCSSDCKVEAGYTCEAPGQLCKLIEWCGDGKLSLARGEQCDDGNDRSSDGCSADCIREANYVCPEPGKLCESTIRCGDGRIAGAEECDDGDVKPADGCSAMCKVESGWTCPAGSTCRAKECGDRIVAGAEQCDDGGKAAGDGCSSECKLELPKDNEPNGWVCPTPGMSCQRTNCGNGTPEGSEQCDDGNNDGGDGCSPFCRREPICPANSGACTTACGDGLLLPIDKMAGQECDDGNTVAGDGCSATCTVERGYSCTDAEVTPNPLILPIVYRDMKAFEETNGHPDFQRFEGQGESGIVQSMLGANGKPAHVSGQKNHTVNNDNGFTDRDYFAIWYKDTAPYTNTVRDTLTFTRLQSGAYRYDNSSFYPLDGRAWGNYQAYNNGIHNYHFTSEIRYWFEYRGNEQLDFTGDDDVWVFVNKRLAVDLGGVHPAQTASMTLHASNGTAAVCDALATNCNNRRSVNLGLQVGSVYEIAVFHAERRIVESNFRLTLTGFNGKRSTCVPVCGDGIVTPNEACDLGTAKNTGAYGTCNANCTLPARCGDGATSDGEQCDNGINMTPYGGTSKVCGAGCKWAPYCGDAMLDSAQGEQCDQGADNGKGYGYCTTSCKWGPRCGDAVTSDGEECDDGALKNGTSASKCMATCELKCGNAMPDPGEQCDDGETNNTGAYGKCRMDCTLGPRCGDGIPNGGEQCDDGKNDGSYGTCAPSCVLGPRCGDTVVQSTAGEVCDRGAENKPSPYGQNQCSTTCRPAPYCGDKNVDVPKGEVCDDGKNDGSPGSCSTDCKAAIPLPSCGDGTKQSNEQCDDGTKNGTGESTCDNRCRLKCGNGFKDAGEQCDDGQNSGAYGTCNANCTLAGYCGDGAKNGPEQCDLGGQNAAGAYGQNKCSASCTTAPFCGDGRIQTGFGEECDGGVGCSTVTCKIIPVQ